MTSSNGVVTWWVGVSFCFLSTWIACTNDGRDSSSGHFSFIFIFFCGLGGWGVVDLFKTIEWFRNDKKKEGKLSFSQFGFEVLYSVVFCWCLLLSHFSCAWIWVDFLGRNSICLFPPPSFFFFLWVFI